MGEVISFEELKLRRLNKESAERGLRLDPVWSKGHRLLTDQRDRAQVIADAMTELQKA